MTAIQLQWFGAAAGTCPFRPVVVREWETLLYTLKAGPAGGLRPPSAGSGRLATSDRPHGRQPRENRPAALIGWRAKRPARGS
jgi:hypothetical protein